MGAWGTGILQNDTTADIWVEFKKYYNQGMSVKDIRIKLEKEYKPEEDAEYYSEIWTGIAHGQWMCGELENYTLLKTKDSINLKWQSLWSDDKRMLQKRLNDLTAFIEKIQISRPEILKRKKIVARPSVFKTGDIIGIKINEDSYLTAIVIEHDPDPTDGANTIVFTDLVFKEKPSRENILNANILYLNVGGTNGYHRGFFFAIFAARNMNKKIKDTLKIDTLKINTPLSLSLGTTFGDWNRVAELYIEEMEFLKKNKSDNPFKLTVAEYLNPDKEIQNQIYDWDKKTFIEKLKRPITGLM